MSRLNCSVSLLIWICMALLPANAATLVDVENSFYPYKNSTPSFNGLVAGVIISPTNVDQFKEILDPAIFQNIKDGWFEMRVGETTSFDLHEAYVQATRDGIGKVSLGDKTGQINGYVSGRPFPEEPVLNDPRAGEKLAWNFKYSYNSGDSGALYPLYSKYRDMIKNSVERTLVVNYHVINFKHRVRQAPIPDITPNPSDIFHASYQRVLEPYDVGNTQLLIQRAEDDLKLDIAWIYLGFQRRVRRLATGQTTDAWLGSDYMIEDFEGYNGRICDMTWTYKETRNLMMPFFKHNSMVLDTETHKDDPEGFQVVSFCGKGNCYPNVTWQLRKVHVVEAVPTDPNHPLSKRVLFYDAQTSTIPRSNIYDRAGRLWKIFIIGLSHADYHLAQNKGTGTAIPDGSTMIDVQANHCTTGQFKAINDPSLCPADMFSVQALRVTGN
jgi:hypothetical protein